MIKLVLKLIVSHRNIKLFRILFFVFFIIVPVLTYMAPEFNSLYVLTVIFLGIGFSNFHRGLLFFCTFLGVIVRTIVVEEDFLFFAFLTRLFIYLLVVYISSEITKQYLEIRQHKIDLILSISKSLDSRDIYTGNHSQNVAEYAVLIAKEMGLSKEKCENIYIGGLLHDIGKIGVPEHILNKPTNLTNDEFEQIKSHPKIGYDMIKHISFLKRDGVLDMVLHHHERFDGKGYPHGLEGKDIPFSARILAVADTFDAMTTQRCYKTPINFDYAISEIENCKGTQFDPEIADIFIKILKNGKKLISQAS
jgi:putative nucleotidyltransferase with HDIG domain